jgi:hypothetical protein
MNETDEKRKRRTYSAPEIRRVELKPEESLSLGCKQAPPPGGDFLDTNGCVADNCFATSGS